eukprot:8568312-Pyramimonas_sp.AAC.1
MVPEESLKFGFQRYRLATCFMPTASSPMLLKNRCGGMMGDPFIVKSFVASIRDPSEAWIARYFAEDDLDHLLNFHCELGSKECDVYVGAHKFADDNLKKIIIGQVYDQERLRSKVLLCDHLLDSSLAPAGYVQNVSKKESIVAVPASHMRGAARLLRELGNSVEDSTRYLGPHLTANQSFTPEMLRRIQAAKKSYFSLGRFWTKKGVPMKWKRCALQCRVVGALVSAAETFLPS